MLSIRDIPLNQNDGLTCASASYAALCVVDDVAFELAALGLGPETLQRVKTLMQEVVEVVIDRLRVQHDDVLADAEEEAKEALKSLREDIDEDHQADLDALKIEHTQEIRAIANAVSDQICALAARISDRPSAKPKLVASAAAPEPTTAPK
jgi:hypothetical protein